MGTHSSYVSIFISGCVFFAIMGIVGSAVHYSLAVNISNYSMPVSYAIGIAYALGVLIQFIANNIVNNNLAESIMLCVGLIVLVYYGFGTDSMAANSARAADGRASYIVYKNEKTAGITLIIIVFALDKSSTDVKLVITAPALLTALPIPAHNSGISVLYEN